MPYSIAQKAKIKSKVLAKISMEFSYADSDEDISEIMDKYGIHLEEEPAYVNTRQMKILVFGALAGKVNDYKMAARKLGISDDCVVFEKDYEKLSRYDVSRLENSMQYSDIIVGPNPHKQTNINGYSSMLSMIKSNPSKYPRLIESHANQALKITIRNFREALLSTRFVEALNY